MLFLDCQGTTLLLALRAEVRPNSMLYFRLPATEAAIQSLIIASSAPASPSATHRIASSKNWQGRDAWLAFFSDPSGNPLAFKVDVPVQP